MNAPSVTAVIPVYNEEDSLGDCLASLAAQDLPAVEVIVVDDGSTDSSPEICRRRGVRTLAQAHKGPGAARNLGAAAAGGEILLFVDADMTFAPDYVSRLIAPIVSGASAAACHWNERVANWDNPWARCQTWYLGNPDGRRQPLAVPERESVYRAVRRDFFLSSGGFAENEGRGDDASVSRRTGVYAAVVPEAVCFHRNVSGPGEIAAEALWAGRDVAVRPERRFRRCVSALLHRNPLFEMLRCAGIAAEKKEPRMLVYGGIYSFFYSAGIIMAFTSGVYRK